MTAMPIADVPVGEAPILRRLPVPLAEPRPALRVVPDPWPQGPAPTQGVLPLPCGTPSDDVAEHRSPTGGPSTPPARAWTRQFVQAALEVAGGRRSLSQLVRWTTEDVYAMLGRRAALAQRIERAGGTVPVTLVRSVRLSRPTEGVVEASAVVIDRGRVRAVALRLEDVAGRWRVSALEIG